jgi:hypothetical protein
VRNSPTARALTSTGARGENGRADEQRDADLDDANPIARVGHLERRIEVLENDPGSAPAATPFHPADPDQHDH